MHRKLLPPLFLLLALSTSLLAKPKLAIQNPETPLLTGDNSTTPNSATILESAYPQTLAISWFPVFSSSEPQWTYRHDLHEVQYVPRFFRSKRLNPSQIPSDPSWKNTLQVPGDSFFSSSDSSGSRLAAPQAPSSFVKFTILLDDPATVYFQNTNDYPFHYNFAKEKLPPFSGYSTNDFDLATLGNTGRIALLGAVIHDALTQSVYIQFVASQPLPPDMVRFLYEQVSNAITNPQNLPTYYLPTSLQQYTTHTYSDYFEANGIAVSSTANLHSTNATYSTGWALGRLRYIASADIEAAYEEGRLLPTDILLTDQIPAELPYLAGILSLSPATPNSHVVILAQTYNIPFAYLSEQHLKERVTQLLDTEIIIDAVAGATIRVEPIATIDPAFKEQLLELKAIPTLDIAIKQTYGAISQNVASLTPADTQYFGGKASNFSYLLQEIPDNTRPHATAFSFDLWDTFLAQEIEPNKTLKQHIDQTLSPYTWPVDDLPALLADLKDIRDLIEDVADFAPLEKALILDALNPFDPNRKIRFRSSTNVEDSEHFSGAGLYDSKSGCLADEQDADDTGPSLCDPTKNNERGVFRALRKTYSSFYNNNAFLERLRFDLDEDQVGMAVLAHYSYPDEIEQANGVIRAAITPDTIELDIVSQPGAASVTNPEPDATPEQTRATWYRNRQSGRFHKSDSSPNSEYILNHPDEYQALALLVAKIAKAFEDDHPEKENYVLDFEYKKVSPGNLEIKQIREIPNQHPQDRSNLLIGAAFDLETFQGEVGPGNSLDNHYLKSHFSLTAKSHFISDGDPGPDFLTLHHWKTHYDGQIVETQSNFLDLPNGTYRYENGEAIYSWAQETTTGDYKYELRFPLASSEAISNLHFASDTRATLTLETPTSLIQGISETNYPEPKTEYLYNTHFTSKLQQPITARLPRGELGLTQRNSPSDQSPQIQTKFFRPPLPSAEVLVGYTFPLALSGETKITGLTSNPILLREPFAQTYGPTHHNFSEIFIYQPGLDPDLPTATKAELEAQNIKYIYYHHHHNSLSEPDTLFYIGPDNQARRAF